MVWVQRVCVLLVLPAVSYATTYCDSNCQPVSETNYRFYCVASDANKFTRCVHGRRHTFSCPTGLVWDPTITNCNWPSAAAPCSCDSNTSPTSSTPTTTASTTKTSTTSSINLTTSQNSTSQTQEPSSTPGSNSTGTENKLSICYFTNWSQYRPGAAKFRPSNIDVSLCTHIIYAFLNFDASRIYFREWNEESMIGQVMALKQSKPSLKVIASIGGWGAGTWAFRQIIASSTSRTNFNRNAIAFLRKWKFDGLDVDFEYPGNAGRGSPTSDRPLFTAWMQSLRADFKAESWTSGQPRFILGAAIAAGKENIDNGYDLPEVSAALDFVSVMTYDYHGSWDGVTGMNAALNSMWPEGTLLDQQTTSWTVEYLLRNGVPPHKLMMGIPLFGRSFSLADSSSNGIGAPARGAGLSGRYTMEAGMNSYFETCMLLKCSDPYNYVYNTPLQVPYIYKRSNWISTEDTRSVKAKAEYVLRKNLGGVMIWALDLDDFADMCKNGVTYPLMKTIVNTLSNRPAPLLASGTTNSAMCATIN